MKFSMQEVLTSRNRDLHLETATVRESLQFSAMLRQPKTVSKKDKYAYVEEVIKMLNMADFAEAVVGVPGSGLNVEQRKLLTIGVELAAKPKLLLFLDEPTSGLDSQVSTLLMQLGVLQCSIVARLVAALVLKIFRCNLPYTLLTISQSSWSIISFLKKLSSAGQAILCTIHQPSAILFQEFDRLLFLVRKSALRAFVASTDSPFSRPRVARLYTSAKSARTPKSCCTTSKTKGLESAVRTRTLPNICSRLSTPARTTRAANGTKYGTTAKIRKKFNIRSISCTRRRRTRVLTSRKKLVAEHTLCHCSRRSGSAHIVLSSSTGGCRVTSLLNSACAPSLRSSSDSRSSKPIPRKPACRPSSSPRS